jgi:hypothetical protein
MSGPSNPQLKLVEIGAVLKKAADDPAFARQLESDPAAAVQSMGYPAPSQDEIAFLQKVIAQQYDKQAADLLPRDPSHTLAEL